MPDLLDTYTLHITMLSPVHIGVEERPGAKEVANPHGHLLRVDERALLEQVAASPALLSRFEQFCLDPDARLSDFLQRERIAPESVTLYSVPRYGGVAARDYYPHIKQPGRPPRPYIPGSSLKGAFRTTALRGMLLTSKRRRAVAETLVRQEMDGRRPNRKRADDALERTFFGPDQHHEWLRLFQFSDSAAVDIDALAVTEVHILSVRGEGAAARLEEKAWRPGRPVASHPEVLLPGATATARVTVLRYLRDEQVARDELHFNPERHTVPQLFKYSNAVAKEALKQEWAFAEETRWREGQMFYGWMVEQLAGLGEDECLLRLGWGTGFDSQTITDLLDDRTFYEVLDRYRLAVGRPGRDMHRDPLPHPFAPKSRQVALDKRERWIPLGWVKVQMMAGEG